MQMEGNRERLLHSVLSVSHSVSEPFRSLSLLSPLEIVYESDEQIGSFNIDQPEPDVHFDVDQNNFKKKSALDHNNCDGSV